MSKSRGWVAVRTIAAPVHFHLFIEYDVEGAPEALKVEYDRRYPVEVGFMIDRALSWTLDELSMARERFETAEDVLRHVPASRIADIERAILMEIAAWQACAIKQPIQGVSS